MSKGSLSEREIISIVLFFLARKNLSSMEKGMIILNFPLGLNGLSSKLEQRVKEIIARTDKVVLPLIPRSLRSPDSITPASPRAYPWRRTHLSAFDF